MIPLIREDFPQPTGPTTAKTSPLLTEKSSPDTVKFVGFALPLASVSDDSKPRGYDQTWKEAFVRVSGGLVSIPSLRDPFASSLDSKNSPRVSRFKKEVMRSTAERACAAPVCL